MKSSLEIAQEAELLPIETIAERMGLTPDEFEPYGRHKAKISLDVIDRMADQPDAKIICVAGVTPTKAGEGKTTTAVGLTQGLGHIGKNPLLCLREPSLGPVFGIKGGAAGGGMTQVVPMEDLNLHFTGDIHAIGAANNLLAALLDASILHGNPHKIDALRVGWKRALDMNDRALRQVALGLGGRANGYPRESGFDITAASEVMAILAVSRDLHDLRQRLGAITVAHSYDGGKPVTAEDLGAAGAMTVLLKDALKPNLIQTLEGQPCLMHCGPFANIAGGGPDRPEAGRLRHHRIRLRVGHGDGEVLRHRVPEGRDQAERGRAGGDRASAEAPRRAGGRPARGFEGGFGCRREGRGQPATPSRDREDVRAPVRGGGEPPPG
jgi:formate--tetrahydrofolate ligase